MYHKTCAVLFLFSPTLLFQYPPSSSLRNVLSYRHFAVVLAFSRFVAIALFLVYSHVSCILFVLRTLLSFLAILSPLLSQLQVIQLCSQWSITILSTIAIYQTYKEPFVALINPGVSLADPTNKSSDKGLSPRLVKVTVRSSYTIHTEVIKLLPFKHLTRIVQTGGTFLYEYRITRRRWELRVQGG